MQKVLSLFHHIHHNSGGHEVHHCGVGHAGVDYVITHCVCGKHRIDVVEAIGHDFDRNEVLVEFEERCPDGGWHVESGIWK